MPGKRLPGFVLRIPFSIFSEFGALASGKRFLFRVFPCPQLGVGRLTTTSGKNVSLPVQPSTQICASTCSTTPDARKPAPLARRGPDSGSRRFNTVHRLMKRFRNTIKHLSMRFEVFNQKLSEVVLLSS